MDSTLILIGFHRLCINVFTIITIIIIIMVFFFNVLKVKMVKC